MNSLNLSWGKTNVYINCTLCGISNLTLQHILNGYLIFVNQEKFKCHHHSILEYIIKYLSLIINESIFLSLHKAYQALCNETKLISCQFLACQPTNVNLGVPIYRLATVKGLIKEYFTKFVKGEKPKLSLKL